MFYQNESDFYTNPMANGSGLFNGNFSEVDRFKHSLNDDLRLKGLAGYLSDHGARWPRRTINPTARERREDQKFEDEHERNSQMALATFTNKLHPEVKANMRSFLDDTRIGPRNKLIQAYDWLLQTYYLNNPAMTVTTLRNDMLQLNDKSGIISLMSRMSAKNAELYSIPRQPGSTHGSNFSRAEMVSFLLTKINDIRFAAIKSHINVRLNKTNMTFEKACQLIKDEINLIPTASASETTSGVSPRAGLYQLQSNVFAASLSPAPTANIPKEAVCSNCNNFNHYARNCKAPYCHRCKTGFSSISDPSYHLSIYCPNQRKAPNFPSPQKRKSPFLNPNAQRRTAQHISMESGEQEDEDCEFFGEDAPYTFEDAVSSPKIYMMSRDIEPQGGVL